MRLIILNENFEEVGQVDINGFVHHVELNLLSQLLKAINGRPQLIRFRRIYCEFKNQLQMLAVVTNPVFGTPEYLYALEQTIQRRHKNLHCWVRKS